MSITALSRVFVTTTLLAAVSLLPSLASAAEPGGYIGGGLGLTRLDIDSAVEDSLNAQGADIDRSGFAAKAFGGYQFNQNFAIEGHIGYQADYQATSSSGARDDLDMTTIGVAGIAYVPVGEVTSLFAKVGLAYWDGLDFDNSNPTPRPESDGEDIFYGLGFEFLDSWRFEWERFEHDDFHSDVFGISYIHRFSTK